MDYISYDDAVELRLKRYFTGEECKYGHVSERLVSNRGCIECMRPGAIKVISREDAAGAGFERYFTGAPCWRGHIARRFTSTGACFDCLARKPSKKLPAGVDYE